MGADRQAFALATFRRKNALSDPAPLTLHAADNVFGDDFGSDDREQVVGLPPRGASSPSR